MVQLVTAVVQASFPGAAVAVYPVIRLPPSVAGADHETSSAESEGVKVTDCGLEGACVVGAPGEGADGFELPTALVATTVTE
jgi:hypothetical protein